MGRSADIPRYGTDRGADAPAVDDTGCNFLHVDMDAFFASVEVRRRPELRGKPLIVGGYGNRGVVASATYEARAFGVRSAMPVSRALRLCPGAIVLPGDHAEYGRVSKSVMKIFASFTPKVQPLSLDEAFLDIAGAIRLSGSPLAIAHKIRAAVEASEGITCSVGIAPTMFLAKIASALCKPDGWKVVPRDGVLEFLHPLPVSVLWGVGPSTGGRLAALGINTVGDLARARPQTLTSNLGAGTAAHLTALARGQDPRAVTPRRTEKSISAEETFYFDTDDPERIRREILRLCEKVGSRVRAGAFLSKTVALKVRFNDFSTISRSRTIPAPTDSTREFYSAACELFDAVVPPQSAPRLRLIGVRAEGLSARDESFEQLVLGEPEHGWQDAERVIDEVAKRFGKSMVRPAALLAKDSFAPGSAGTPATGSTRSLVDPSH